MPSVYASPLFVSCFSCKLYTGINVNAQLLSEIEKVNARNGARNFSTLYTNINLEDLAEKLKSCVDIVFIGGIQKLQLKILLKICLLYTSPSPRD